MSVRAQLEDFVRRAEAAIARGETPHAIPPVHAGLLLRHMSAQSALIHAKRMVEYLTAVVEAESRAKTLGGARGR